MDEVAKDTDASVRASAADPGTSTKGAPATKSTDSETNIKETIESILIAFILAFIFRGFVVEAFVIPTGSMAPTLLGAHMRFRCDDCGYEWTVNYSGAGDGDDVVIPTHASDTLVDANGNRAVDRSGRPLEKVVHAICPNCGYRVQRRGEADNNDFAANPAVHYGDRILVLKYLYLFQQPQRWDVVVFKSPDRPAEYDYQQNYIKRLVGRPGESIMVLDGDVYAAPNIEGQDPKLEDFVVQTKPRHVQDALWRVVYDNDYLPQNKASGRANGTERPWTQPWKEQVGQSGWQSLTARTFQFNNPTGRGDIYFDATSNPEQQSLSDWLAYDVTFNQSPADDQRIGPDAFNRELYTADANVSDVRLTFYYQRQSGDGPIRAQVSKLDHFFTAEINSGRATLFESVHGGPRTEIQSAPIDADLSTPTRIDLINCDYQVTLRINDRDIIQTTPQQYHPDVEQLMKDFNQRRLHPKPTIRILADKQQCMISHVSLWRDVFYLDRSPTFNGGRDIDHASPAHFPNGIMRLKANPPEYFCCGDNSPISEDGRYWDAPIELPHEDLDIGSGKVPGRFLLGKAFFVYWPAGFRPIDSAPALVPDFGDMRFIH